MDLTVHGLKPYPSKPRNYLTSPSGLGFWDAVKGQHKGNETEGTRQESLKQKGCTADMLIMAPVDSRIVQMIVAAVS